MHACHKSVILWHANRVVDMYRFLILHRATMQRAGGNEANDGFRRHGEVNPGQHSEHEQLIERQRRLRAHRSTVSIDSVTQERPRAW